jgi:UDP-glucose 4-epimerase
VTTLAWVIGGGGLLGSHVEAELGRSEQVTVWERTGGPFPWGHPARLEERFAETIRGFLEAGADDRSRSIFWCAGAGVVGTSAAELAEETETWERFLDRLGAERDLGRAGSARPLSISFASSAGGVYAGSSELPTTESSPTRPQSAYGEAKLRQERALADWARERPEISSLVARIANLYGPGQKGSKPQGLISQMSRCLIHHRPVHIYVPLDTVRDFVFVEDAAQSLVRWMERLSREAEDAGRGVHVLKICASERPTTIAGLVGVFRRLAKRQLRVVSGLHPLSGQHPRRLQFRSTVWSDEPRPDATSLLVGIDRVYRHQLALSQGGALLPPEPVGLGISSGPVVPPPTPR